MAWSNFRRLGICDHQGRIRSYLISLASSSSPDQACLQRRHNQDPDTCTCSRRLPHVGQVRGISSHLESALICCCFTWYPASTARTIQARTLPTMQRRDLPEPRRTTTHCSIFFHASQPPGPLQGPFYDLVLTWGQFAEAIQLKVNCLSNQA